MRTSGRRALLSISIEFGDYPTTINTRYYQHWNWLRDEPDCKARTYYFHVVNEYVKIYVLKVVPKVDVVDKLNEPMPSTSSQ
jgi:hypothetical protein